VVEDEEVVEKNILLVLLEHLITTPQIERLGSKVHTTWAVALYHGYFSRVRAHESVLSYALCVDLSSRGMEPSRSPRYTGVREGNDDGEGTV